MSVQGKMILVIDAVDEDLKALVLLAFDDEFVQGSAHPDTPGCRCQIHRYRSGSVLVSIQQAAGSDISG